MSRRSELESRCESVSRRAIWSGIAHLLVPIDAGDSSHANIGMIVCVDKYVGSSAQGNCSAKSFAALVMSSILPCSSNLPCPPCLPPIMLSTGWGGSSYRGFGHRRGFGWGEGVREGEGAKGGGGRAYFIHPAIYCTTTWCYALKGLRTINAQ